MPTPRSQKRETGAFVHFRQAVAARVTPSILLLVLTLALAACVADAPGSPRLDGAAAVGTPDVAPVETRRFDLVVHGRAVTLDVHRTTGEPRGAALLSHGFTRSRSTMGGHAQALARDGVLALTVDLPYTFDFERNAQALAELVGQVRRGGVFGPAVDRVILVGFSAGALSSLLAAHTPGVVGYIGLDPFDRVHRDRSGALGLDFAPKVDVPVLLLRAPPSRCNAQSVAAPWSAVLRRLEADQLIDGASHCDFESPTDWICRWACGHNDARRQALVGDALVAASWRWMPVDSQGLAAPGR
jgi:dienelactone hydrolase